MAGAWRDGSWEPERAGLRPGDVLVLFTDGVTDARGPGGRFGEARLREAVRTATDARNAVARIEAALDAFETGAQADDMAVIAVMRTGGG
jgi:serine phosphatase RsbU (regulator of sigma subunit)